MTQELKDRQEQELRRLYRQVFGTEHGKKVLFSILQDLGFLSETEGDRAALRNYATFLIRDRIGVNDARGFMAVVEAMLSSGK